MTRERELGWILLAAEPASSNHGAEVLVSSACCFKPSHPHCVLHTGVILVLPAVARPIGEPWKNKGKDTSCGLRQPLKIPPGSRLNWHEPSGNLTAVLQQGLADPLASQRLAL